MSNIKIINPYKRNKLRHFIVSFLPFSFIKQLKKYVIKQKMLKYSNLSYFSAIGIETMNKCNNDCSFCPINFKLDKRPFEKMDEVLFRKIVNELSEIYFAGYLGMSSNNEPYMDKRLVSWIGYAREKCPSAYIYLYTNGILLDSKKVVQSIDAGISSIVIDNYNDNLVLNDNIKEIVKELEKRQYTNHHDKIDIVLRKKTEILTNRGGTAPNKKPNVFKAYMAYWDVGCVHPFYDIVVRPNGKISLCCEDALGQVTLGDVTEQTLLEIWKGSKYTVIRKELLNKGRKNLTLCNVCDSSYLSLRDVVALTKENVLRIFHKY